MQQVSKLGTGAMAKGENPQTSKAERRDTENTHTHQKTATSTDWTPERTGGPLQRYVTK